MLRQKDVIEKCNLDEIEARLFRSVMRQIGDWQSVVESPESYRDAGQGVSGFIYYAETVPFAKKHLSDILIVLNRMEQELGEPLRKPDDPDPDILFNWFAYFACEWAVDMVMQALEW